MVETTTAGSVCRRGAVGLSNLFQSLPLPSRIGVEAWMRVNRFESGLKRARYYQSLPDSGVVQTRSEVARHLGVSRARVTQVLQRLERPKDDVG